MERATEPVMASAIKHTADTRDPALLSSSAALVMPSGRGDLIVAFQYLKGPTERLARDFLEGHIVTEQGAMAINWMFILDLD